MYYSQICCETSLLGPFGLQRYDNYFKQQSFTYRKSIRKRQNRALLYFFNISHLDLEQFKVRKSMLQMKKTIPIRAKGKTKWLPLCFYQVSTIFLLIAVLFTRYLYTLQVRILTIWLLITASLKFILLQTLLKEITIGGDVLVVGIGTGEGMAAVVEQDVEGLGIGAELASLEVAPAVADGAERHVDTVLLDGQFLRQGSLLVNVERNEHILLPHQFCHLGVCPDGGLHLAAVHAAVAGEVKHHGHSMSLGVCHSLVVVVKVSLYGSISKTEVLCAHRGAKALTALQGAPQSPGTI